MIFKTIKSRLLLSFLFIILILGISKAVLVYYIIEKDIIKKAQQEVKVRLNTARAVFIRDIDIFKTNLTLISDAVNPISFKEKLDMDYLYIVSTDKDNIKSEIVKKAIKEKKGFGGVRIISKEELLVMNNGLYERAKIDIKDTPQARPVNLKVLEDAMAIE
ncbi:MAG TPA: hypothetical protein PL110_14315, partial [Candidatus Eremiobacteraeota bacterium]|nr:hypothetical protein [Candidatus Eremiobacteraeota bacterium]